jgi:Zn finger protein HypA/HybF involved in hydrogenase expression
MMLTVIHIGREKRDWHAGYGKFHCRICRGERSYTLIKSCNYFMLSFIPIFPLEKASEVVECHDCGRQFETDALSYTPTPGPKERLLARVVDQLAAGKSAEEVRDIMTQPGVSADLIQQAIHRALGGSVRTCARCNLHYSQAALGCLKCGDALLEG